MNNLMPSGRIGWIETLKGITICLVVIHHVTLTTQHFLLNEHGTSLPEGILTLDQFLSYCRMPAFFFCAGLVFSRNIHKGRAWLINRRVLGAGWIIIVWTSLSYLFHMSGLKLIPWSDEKIHLFRALWSPFGVLWFMHAIMICTITSFLLRNLSVKNQILVAVTLTIFTAHLSHYLSPTYGLRVMLDGLAASGFLFFIAGSALGSNATRIIEDDRHVVFLFIFFILLIYLYLEVDRRSYFLDLLFLRIPITFVFICFVRGLFDRFQQFGLFFSRLGARSLRIFVTHQFVIATALAIWVDHIDEAFPRSMWLMLILFTAGGTFVTQKSVYRLTGGLAYEPPRWLALGRSANRPSSSVRG